MNKKILSVVASCALASQLYAGGDVETVAETVIEVPHVQAHAEEAHHEASKFYVVVKGLTILGDDVPHGVYTYDGDQGYGFGIDLGYRIGYGFAVEYAYSYATNKVINSHYPTVEEDATYMTNAIFLAYTYHLSHTTGVFIKGGYENEEEEIDGLGVDQSNSGFAYAVGLEYAMNDHYTLVAEYAGSDIEGPRGDAIFLGVMYNF